MRNALILLLQARAAALLASVESDGTVLHSGGIFPGLAATAKTGATRSESGNGALFPWADRLWMVSYLSFSGAGEGSAFYVVYQNMTMDKLHEHNSCYANRMIHSPSNQAFIGPYAIDADGNWRVITDLLHDRLGGMAEHLLDPANKVYMLSMDGPLYEVDVHTLAATELANLVVELGIDAKSGEQPHFKAMHTINGQTFVASNTFEQQDFEGAARQGTKWRGGGRLASWDGKNTSAWQILERTAFVEITGRRNFGRVAYAVGWDAASAILKVLDPALDGAWMTYRLPKASHAYDHLWQTEWPRIREVETERYLADIHGAFYEISPLGWGGAAWGIRPVAQHLRIVPDFTSYRGFLVLGGNQVSSIFDNNLVTGQSQAGLWFGKTDDLWQFGPPRGWGGPWRHDNVTVAPAFSTDMSTISDPFLMTGFDKKTLHVETHGCSRGGGFPPETIPPVNVAVDVLVDYTGLASSGHTGAYRTDEWALYKRLSFPAPDSMSGTYGYAYAYSIHHAFEPGFSAHWVALRLVHSSGSQAAVSSCNVSALFHYS